MIASQDTIQEQSDFRSIIALFNYGQGNYKNLFLAIGFILASSAVLMMSAKLMGLLAEALVSGAEQSRIASLVAGILLFESVNLLVYYKGRVGLARVTNEVAYGIRVALFNKLGRLPIPYFDQEPLGRTMTRLTADVEGIESFFSNTLPRVFTAVITITSVLLAMLLTDWKFGAVIVASSLPAVMFTIALRKPVRSWLREYKKRSAALNAQLAEFINGLSVIKIFGIEGWTKKEFDGSSRHLLRAAISLMNWNSFIRPLAALLCALPILVILWYGGHQALDESISIGLLVAFVRYGERYFRPIMMLSFELHLIQDAIASSERVRKMLDEKTESDTLNQDGTRQQKIQGKIEYRNVWMEYKKDSPVLKDVSFTINAGESVALVGRTGSGKTTTIQLLPQLYGISGGEILIDNKPLSEWSRLSIRQQMGIVSQDVTIFHGSIRDNLIVALPDGHPGVPDEELLAICQRTGLFEVIDRLPQKLDTVCLDNGANFSMGERQLMAFTRMLVRDPAILVLDEATANVDEAFEAKIQQAIQEVLKGRTTFVIAHRLNTIQDCDKILVFDQGRVVEQGQHKGLLAQDGAYSKLVSRQIYD
ncbi:ABC transporter ATP-binding protein [Pseudobacteriovorax antillogorgiicola]|uniref:Multidrug resistance-like ATP-binding protein MdlB n=1 Tax=Pseudobacteriovorax antillogorgiicola TaxID=1513793 RepID=A0A1Y6CBW1_9BACT|nr:ABC transporter ATP-binding protein [Pseudobacteriovorax antillogorgiicola]TCS48589.1 ATP-binding cassette subfamily B protein [Pseudobacteriovorax antillogorgiicola]SMF55652.1 ATP-binding cassette, subfamily B [Pseudobacteriovorax antillogorgiicola]